LERHIFDETPSTWNVATWAWALSRKDPTRKSLEAAPPVPKLLNQLLTRWLFSEDEAEVAGFALSTLVGMQRDSWKPTLTEEEKLFVKRMADAKIVRRDNQIVALIVGFHSRDVWSDEELARRLFSLKVTRSPRRPPGGIDSMLQQFDEGLAIIRAKETKEEEL
jgi:hypothetical protein